MVLGVSLTEEMDRTRRTRTAIEALIADPAQLGPDFQPIVRLDESREVVGWKATGRGKEGTAVADTLSLLSGAQSLGLVERLDWAFRCHAFDVALAARISGELHLTPEPETFGSACPPRLAASWGRGRRELDVVAELHEDAFNDFEVLRRAVDEMRGWGFRFVVADLSGDREVATTFEWLRPEYVQVDVRILGALGAPAVRGWLTAAPEAGAQLMAIGVDTEASLEAAIEAGATCGRGALLGAPTALPTS
jgi:EAL domain-containing protein (putative c-di-GMP-specific phosphodiesterase class I)